MQKGDNVGRVRGNHQGRFLDDGIFDHVCGNTLSEKDS
jgi:hypothetical protein